METTRKALRVAFQIVCALVCAALVLPGSCVEERINARIYWFSERYYGVRKIRDTGEYRTGIIRRGRLRICFEVPLVELQDRTERIFGYRDAMEEWALDFIREGDPRARSSLQKISRLLRVGLRSPKEFQAWWHENAEYLAWSEEKGYLVVDENAKRARTPTVPFYTVMDISTEEYWFRQGNGSIRDVIVKGDYVEGWVGIGHGTYPFRILASRLEDRNPKETAYRRAVRNDVEALQRMKSLPHLGPDDAEWPMKILRRLTDREFRDPDSWLKWWEENKDKLALSDDGQRLIVRH